MKRLCRPVQALWNFRFKLDLLQIMDARLGPDDQIQTHRDRMMQRDYVQCFPAAQIAVQQAFEVPLQDLRSAIARKWVACAREARNPLTRDLVECTVRPLLAMKTADNSVEIKAARALGISLSDKLATGELSQVRIDMAAWIAQLGCSPVQDKDSEIWTRTLESMLYAMMQKARALREGRQGVWKGQEIPLEQA